jgi:hypothetical protein
VIHAIALYIIIGIKVSFKKFRNIINKYGTLASKESVPSASSEV